MRGTIVDLAVACVIASSSGTASDWLVTAASRMCDAGDTFTLCPAWSRRKDLSVLYVLRMPRVIETGDGPSMPASDAAISVRASDAAMSVRDLMELPPSFGGTPFELIDESYPDGLPEYVTSPLHTTAGRIDSRRFVEEDGMGKGLA